MAERPIKEPLPADLPENWQAEQIVAPTGEEVGLTHQHGYNYLMEMVNRAQRGVNSVNEAFDTVSGKRTCRFVVGTSTAGWTAADCDYLCDGTDDQVEIQAAIDALPSSGGEIVLLSGEYTCSENLRFSDEKANITLTGNPGSTIIKMSQLSASGYLTKRLVLLRYITFMPVEEHQPALISAINLGLTIQNCSLINTSLSFFHNAGNESDFWCVGNTFKIEDGLDTPNNWNALYIVPTAKTNQGNCIVYQNNFQVGADGSSSSRNILVNIDLENGNNVVFVGNTVRCLKGGWEIRARDGGVLSGNSFSGFDATITNYGLFSANHMYNGTLYVIGDNGTSDNINASAVTGNTLKNVSVQISGNVDFSANGVYAPIGETAVAVYKSVPNASQDYSPAVVGNYIIGGNIGVHLLDAGGNIPQSPNIGRAMVNSNKIIGASIPIQLDAHWSNCMVTDNLFASGSIVDNGSNNIIRNNSDEAGSSSGGSSTTVAQAVPTLSVSPEGVVTATSTQAAGNVAAGTRTATKQLTAQDDPDLVPENIREGVSIFGVAGAMQAVSGGVTSETVAVIQTLTEEEYSALAAKDSATLYLIKE